MTLRKFGKQTPRLGQGVYIDPSAVVIGNVELAEDVSVWPTSVIRGDVNEICIGAASNIQDGSVLHVTHDGQYTPGGYGLYLGRGVTVGHKAVLHGCRIGDYCLIGMGAIVMDGAVVEDHVLIAAGALVTPGTKLPAGTLWQGSPARKVRELSEAEFQQLEYSAAHYVRIKEQYRHQGNGDQEAV
ncbi:MAG: gamma carbonic anhydrase family protein [Wenzhouxiangellaceae bacterium]